MLVINSITDFIKTLFQKYIKLKIDFYGIRDTHGSSLQKKFLFRLL